MTKQPQPTFTPEEERQAMKVMKAMIKIFGDFEAKARAIARKAQKVYDQQQLAKLEKKMKG